MLAPASETIDELYVRAIKTRPIADRMRLLVLLALDAATLVPPEASEPEKMAMTERLARANYTGGRLFKTGAEVDAYRGEERDSWER